MLMIKWEQRRKISKKLNGLILPHMVKKLKEKSWNLDMEMTKCSEEVAEVTVHGGSGFKFAVRLHERTCICREWQVSSIPCTHAIAHITGPCCFRELCGLCVIQYKSLELHMHN